METLNTLMLTVEYQGEKLYVQWHRERQAFVDVEDAVVGCSPDQIVDVVFLQAGETLAAAAERVGPPVQKEEPDVTDQFGEAPEPLTEEPPAEPELSTGEKPYNIPEED